MKEENRVEITKQRLYRIMQSQGTIYTLGLLMGIISRLTQYDYQLYKELEAREENLKNKR